MPLTLLKAQYKVGNENHIIMPLPRKINNRTMVLVPVGTKRPSWNTTLNLDAISAATTITNERNAFSYVEATDRVDELFDSEQAQATLGTAVEACQQSIITGAFKNNGEIVKDAQENSAI